MVVVEACRMARPVTAQARALLIVFGIVAFFLVVYRLRAVLTPVFFAFLLAYMLDPLVDRLQRIGLPRVAAIAALLGASLGAIALFVLFALPAVVRDVAVLAQQLPSAVGRLLEQLGPQLSAYGFEVPVTVDDWLRSLEGGMRKWSASALAPVKTVVSWLLGGTASLFSALAALVMVPVLTFYLLSDFEAILKRVHDLVPLRFRAELVSIAREADGVVGQFIRGQVTVMAVLAALYALGFSLVGVPLAVPIGATAGLLAFIPYLGSAAALGMALLMSALHFDGTLQLILVVAVVAIVQVLDGFFITPRIVGDRLGLSPLWVLLSLMLGGELFGFLGVMLALPSAAVVKVFAARGVAKYSASEFFLGKGPQADGAVDKSAPHQVRRQRRRLRGLRR